MKALMIFVVGFVGAALLFATNVELARIVAAYAVISGLALIAIVVAAMTFIALAVAINPGNFTVIASLISEHQSKKKVPVQKVAKKPFLANFIRSEKKDALPRTVSSPVSPVVDYEKFEVPTYLRRGYDRGMI